MWTCKHVYEVYNLSARNIDLGPANRPTPVPEDTERSYIDGPDGIPIDSVTGEPYWVAELERQFAAADAERRERERKGRLRKLQHPARRRRSYPLDVGDQVGTSPPLSTRLPRWLDEQIRQELDALDVSPSTGVRQILEEWWVTRRYPALEFRGGSFLRFASIRGGMDVKEWAEMNPRPDLPPDATEQVLDYLELFKSRLRVSPARGPRVPPSR